MVWILGFSFFVVFAVILVAFVFGSSYVEQQRRKQVVQVLHTVSNKPKDSGRARSSVLRTDQPKTGLDALEQVEFLQPLKAKLEQSSTGVTLGKLAAATVFAGAIGVVMAFFLPLPFPFPARALVLSSLLATVPYFNAMHKRNKKFRAIEEHLPDALDFLARSIRAGHALTISLELVADDSPEPLRSELRTLCNEQSLGASFETSLQHFAERVPILDVKFLVSTLIMQRETGGNLGEILNKLAYVIRERFRLRGQVKAASAHGKLTGIILTLLPLVTCGGLMLVSPGYISGMAADRTGKLMLFGAVMGQILGYMTIRKIVNIKI